MFFVNQTHYSKAFFSFSVLPPEVRSGQKVNSSFSLTLIAKYEYADCSFSLSAEQGCAHGAVEASGTASEPWGLICVLSSGSGSSGALWTGTHLEMHACGCEIK